MKKEIKKIASVVLLSAMLVGCAKDFFDPEVNEYVTEERKKELRENPQSQEKLVAAELKGIYNNNVATQNNSHDSFGLKAIDVGFDHMGLDLVQRGRSWFIFDYNINNKQANYRRPAFLWNFLYKQISAINTILKENFTTVPSDPGVFQRYGELKTLRAIYYYYLVNSFAKTYQGNEGGLGVPLMLSTQNEKLPRATIAQVYDQMIRDLEVVNDARFQTTETDHTDADKAVGAAYLAKIYACKREWNKVEQYALIAMGGTSTPTLTPSGDVEAGKWDINMPSWLWGFDITKETKTYWNSFYAHMDNSMPDSYAGGGSFRLIYKNLYDKIGLGDVRKKLFVNSTRFPILARKYKQLNPNLPEYASMKYVTNSDFTGDYCFLRIEDPFLLYIEALVELNRLDEARNALVYLVKDKRGDTDYNPPTFDQARLREEVRTQRRIELWGEGTAFFDWKRWNVGIDRYEAGSNHIFKIAVPAGDEKWTYQIPKSEMESNPNMVQNE